MREIFGDIARWRGSGRRVALAVVVDVEGSGPRLPGAAMAVSEDGEVAGSVSGGCVEGAVVAEALQLLGDSGPGRLVTYGYSDDEAFAVGLTCGGTVHIFIQEPDWSIFDEVAMDLEVRRPLALVTEVDGPNVGRQLLVRPGLEPLGSLGDVELDKVVVRDALAELEFGRSGVRHFGPHGEAGEQELSLFIESFAAPPRMLIFGAVDFTAALLRVAKVLGFVVTVCDAREAFATDMRFPLADEVVVDWPHRLLAKVGHELTASDAVCVLTHDHKFDVPAILAAFRTRAGYIGAMGSRRTTAERQQRLLDEGATRQDLSRLHAPIGIDIAARTPEEVAVAICAEIIAARTGRAGTSLSRSAGPLHVQ